MRLFLPRLAAFVALTALASGCGPGDDNDRGLGPAGDDDDVTDLLFAVAGTWLQPDGTPVDGIAVTVSTESCIAEDGSFRVERVSPGAKRLIT
jgi:hypothetical protein